MRWDENYEMGWDGMLSPVSLYHWCGIGWEGMGRYGVIWVKYFNMRKMM